VKVYQIEDREILVDLSPKLNGANATTVTNVTADMVLANQQHYQVRKGTKLTLPANGEKILISVPELPKGESVQILSPAPNSTILKEIKAVPTTAIAQFDGTKWEVVTV
jgi:hypothetical protein